MGINLSDKEIAEYSICRAICRAILPGKNGENCLEREISDQIKADLKGQIGNRSLNGIMIPSSLPFGVRGSRAMAMAEAQRATSATAYGATINGTGAGSLVATDLLAGSFIDVLRAKAKVMSLGPTLLSDLKGNVAIPRQDTPSSAYWLNPEGADVTESEGTFDQVLLNPKTVGAKSQYTRQLLMQSSPDIEMLVRNDLAKVMALAIDAAAINGTGANGQPQGILGTAGIGSVALGANGGPLTLDALVALETSLTEANVDEEGLAYLTNAKQIGVLKSMLDADGRFIWTQYPGIFGQRTAAPRDFNGYPMVRSNNVPKNLTKGSGTNLSAVLFGNWQDLLIGEWGAIELLPNPYGAGFNSGSIEVRALQSVDVQLRHPASFAAITDAT